MDLASDFIVKYIGSYKYKNENGQTTTIPKFELIYPIGEVNPHLKEF